MFIVCCYFNKYPINSLFFDKYRSDTFSRADMSDNFIPLNQSTPVGERWQGRQQGGYHHRNQNGQGQRRYNNRYGNNSYRNSSYGSDSNNSFGQDKNNIDAYLHPSMLQDPWAQLRRKQNND